MILRVAGTSRRAGSMAELRPDVSRHATMPRRALQGQRNDEGQRDRHSTQAGAAGAASMWLMQRYCRTGLHAPCSTAGARLHHRIHFCMILGTSPAVRVLSVYQIPYVMPRQVDSTLFLGCPTRCVQAERQKVGQEPEQQTGCKYKNTMQIRFC
jgi:hypothetical protein